MAKAVIFDKDGVLIHTTRLYFERWKKTFAQFDKKLTLDFHNNHLEGRKASESIKRHLKSDISQEDLTKLLEEQLNFMLINFNKYIKPVEGVLDFLSKLKSAKIPVALGTSSRKEMTKHVLDTLNLRQYFNEIVDGDDVKHGKPSPDIYLKAAKLLKTEPKNCVVFEDSYSGVEAAKKAGMKVVLVMTSHTQKEIPGVDLAIKDFTKITLKDIKFL